MYQEEEQIHLRQNAAVPNVAPPGYGVPVHGTQITTTNFVTPTLQVDPTQYVQLADGRVVPVAAQTNVHVTGQPQIINPNMVVQQPLVHNPIAIQNQVLPVGNVTWVDPTDIRPGYSMPNPVPSLSPGINFQIPADKMVSIHALNQTSIPENNARDYLMSNDQDFCVILTKYDKAYSLMDSLLCREIDTFHSPEKLVGGSVQKPLFDITSWEEKNNGGYRNFFSFRDQTFANKGASNSKNLLDNMSWFNYQSLFEAIHWSHSDSFVCTYMSSDDINRRMIDQFRKWWNNAHIIDEADHIYKNQNLNGDGTGTGTSSKGPGIAIGRAIMVPYEFKESHRRRHSRVKRRRGDMEYYEDRYHLDHTAEYNLECRIYSTNSIGNAETLLYRIRAVTDYPTAEKNYLELQPEEGSDIKPEDMKGEEDVYFVILDGNVEQPVGPHSVLGSAVMQSCSNKMVIKFPVAADEDDRIRLFSSLTMLENFMRSRSCRKVAKNRMILICVLGLFVTVFIAIGAIAFFFGTPIESDPSYGSDFDRPRNGIYVKTQSTIF